MAHQVSVDELEDRCWWWRGKVVPRPRSEDEGVYDGDTVWVMIDRGWHDHSRRSVRLSAIDAPEIRGPERPLGLLSKERLLELLPLGERVYLRTRKWQGKYGRYVADVYVETSPGTATLVNQMLVEEGLAEPRDE